MVALVIGFIVIMMIPGVLISRLAEIVNRNALFDTVVACCIEANV